jgi:hypothetical protein
MAQIRIDGHIDISLSRLQVSTRCLCPSSSPIGIIFIEDLGLHITVSRLLSAIHTRSDTFAINNNRHNRYSPRPGIEATSR